MTLIIFPLKVRKCRPALTLPEVLIFMVLVGMMMGTITPLIFQSTEARQRQDAIALVEQNGAQIMQSIVRTVRNAERVLDPQNGKSGYILTLQMENHDENPSIIAKEHGSIILVRGRTRRNLNSELVGVTHFAVSNTAAANGEQSVAVSLGLRRTIRVLQPISYEATFNTVITLHPDHEHQGNICGGEEIPEGYPDCEEDGTAQTDCIATCIGEIDDDPDDLSNPPDLCDDACEADCAEACEDAGSYTWHICDEIVPDDGDPEDEGIAVPTWVPQRDFRCDLIDED